MTGIDLAYAMSEHSTLSDVPLVLTGDDGDLGRLEAFRAGVRDYIPRPFLDEELVIRVHRVAAPRPRRPARACAAASSTSASARCCRCSSSSARAASCSCSAHGEIARVFVADGRILKVEAHRRQRRRRGTA